MVARSLSGGGPRGPDRSISGRGQVSMRKLIRLSALLLIMMLAIAGTRSSSVLAQDDATAESGSAFDDLTQLEGLEEAVGRTYSFDYEALMANASPEDFENFEYPEGIQYLSAIVLKFDSDDNAKAALDLAAEELPNAAGDDIELTEIEVDGFNDDTLALGATEEDEELGPTATTAIITQEDEYLYLTIGVASGEGQDATETVSELAKQVIDGDTGGDATFNEDGTSEGGLWDKFPDAGSELVEGLVATDEQIFPEPEGE